MSASSLFTELAPTKPRVNMTVDVSAVLTPNSEWVKDTGERVPQLDVNGALYVVDKSGARYRVSTSKFGFRLTLAPEKTATVQPRTAVTREAEPVKAAPVVTKSVEDLIAESIAKAVPTIVEAVASKMAPKKRTKAAPSNP